MFYRMIIVIPTLIFAASYCAHIKYFRRACGGIWSSTTKPYVNREMSPEVQEITHNWRKGFKFLMTFVEESVFCLF